MHYYYYYYWNHSGSLPARPYDASESLVLILWALKRNNEIVFHFAWLRSVSYVRVRCAARYYIPLTKNQIGLNSVTSLSQLLMSSSVPLVFLIWKVRSNGRLAWMVNLSHQGKTPFCEKLLEAGQIYLFGHHEMDWIVCLTATVRLSSCPTSSFHFFHVLLMLGHLRGFTIWWARNNQIAILLFFLNMFMHL